MSRGRYLMLWTILLHLAGLVLSYLYGVLIPVWIGRVLPGWAGFVRVAAFWLYSRPVLLLPHAMQSAFLRDPGLAWLSFAVCIQLCSLLHYLGGRAKKRDLGTSYAGHPGGQYWENVQRRFKEYQEAIKRWHPQFTLRTPTWCYYKRQESRQPDLFWRGRTLIIEKDLLKGEQVQELAPKLARELMYYNCDDVLFKDMLAYYPEHFTRGQWLLHLLGLCIFFPVMCMQWFVWPSYWEKRTLVADAFAYRLGQGHLLSFHIQTALQQDEQVKEKRREVTREIQKLKERMRAYTDDDDLSLTFQSYRSGYSDSHDHHSRQQLAHQLTQLRQWEQQLLQQEQQAFEVHPMLEQRREQLAALLGTEQAWMEQRGVAPSAWETLLPLREEPRRLWGPRDGSTGTR